MFDTYREMRKAKMEGLDQEGFTLIELLIVIVVLGVGGGELEQRRGELRDEAFAGQRVAERGSDSVAGEASLGLLVGG